MFPHASVAFQVLVIEKLPAQFPGVVSVETTLTVAVPQVSVAVGAVNSGVAGQSIVALAPAAEINGAIVSCIFIVCDAEIEPQKVVTVNILVTTIGQVPVCTSI